ncbi:hypothetical protein TNCV_1481271 [Trichonephila clavipes]|nr:hypothetical protein TNCV_1481271 [Trichonephila clavipes]
MPPTSFFHRTTGGGDVCGSASRVDQAMVILRTDHYAVNGVKCYAQTLNDALQTQCAALRSEFSHYDISFGEFDLKDPDNFLTEFITEFGRSVDFSSNVYLQEILLSGIYTSCPHLLGIDHVSEFFFHQSSNEKLSQTYVPAAKSSIETTTTQTEENIMKTFKTTSTTNIRSEANYSFLNSCSYQIVYINSGTTPILRIFCYKCNAEIM